MALPGDVGLLSSVPVCTVRKDLEPPPHVGEFERIVMLTAAPLKPNDPEDGDRSRSANVPDAEARGTQAGETLAAAQAACTELR